MGEIILVIGNDKLGRKLINYLESNFYDVSIYLDASPMFGRLMKLLLKKRFSIKHFYRMTLAAVTRRDYFVRNYPYIRSNEDLIDVINEKKPKIIYFFRAGIIVNKIVINKGVPLVNVHCNSLPEYSGIASIARALDEKAYAQHATMHRITENIDRGDILREEPYVMFAENSYQKNEDIAYGAGIKLLLQELSNKLIDKGLN